ncbi:MAG: hypothetical protein [Circular genetic element sp.]|nr:MAG: hypothetical protein [Circular genetic element sp.]
MVKGKVAKEGLKKLGKTKFARGAGIAGGARAAEEAVSNPYAQAALGAVEGAALGSALGPLGAAGGAVAGGLLGFVLADGERIVPVDMIAIPAYQYSAMLQGREPTFQLFIKEGECIKPVIPTDFQMAGNVVLQDTVSQAAFSKPKRKLSKWQRYIKVKKNQIKFKNGKLDLKKMGRAYRKANK